jgi:2-methylcitrate dehydratase PrpD
LRKQPAFDVQEIKSIRVGTFHESWRLAMRELQTTEQAQYSLPFPIAVALVHGLYRHDSCFENGSVE